MNYREIAATGIKVSEISFGCMTMGEIGGGDGTPQGLPKIDENEITAALKSGLDAGVNHFDNADIYAYGRCERLLARAFHRLGVKSTDYIIASKVGHFKGTAEHAYEPAHIRHQCEQSLINLRRDYIDIYYFHHANFGENDRYLAEAAETMNALVKEGKVRVKGQSAYSEADFERVVPVVQPAALQSWAHALDDHFVRPGSRVSQLLEKYGMSFVAFSPLAQGRLLDKFNPENPPQFERGDNRQTNADFSAEALLKLKPRIEMLKGRFGGTADDLAAMALHYVLGQPRVACTIPGFRNERQARCNISGAGRILTDDDIRFIRETLAPVHKTY